MTDFFKPDHLKTGFGEEVGPIYCQDSRPCSHYVLFIVYLELVVPSEVFLLLPAFTVRICSKPEQKGLEHKRRV